MVVEVHVFPDIEKFLLHFKAAHFLLKQFFSVVVLQDLHIYQGGNEASDTASESHILSLNFHTAKMLSQFAYSLFLLQALHSFAFAPTLVWLIPNSLVSTWKGHLNLSIMRETFEINFQLEDKLLLIPCLPLLWELQVHVIHVISKFVRLGDGQYRVSSH